jgi:hypothetical protein
MDTHHKIVAVLHILAAAFVLLVIGTISLFFGAVSAIAPAREFPFDLLLTFGGVIMSTFAIVAVAQLVAAAMLLKGHAGARPWVIGFGILHLLNFPFGTALGVYTLWALLRN